MLPEISDSSPFKIQCKISTFYSNEFCNQKTRQHVQYKTNPKKRRFIKKKVQLP